MKRLSPHIIVIGTTFVVVLLAFVLSMLDMQQHSMFQFTSLFQQELPEEKLLENTLANTKRADGLTSTGALLAQETIVPTTDTSTGDTTTPATLSRLTEVSNAVSEKVSVDDLITQLFTSVNFPDITMSPVSSSDGQFLEFFYLQFPFEARRVRLADKGEVDLSVVSLEEAGMDFDGFVSLLKTQGATSGVTLTVLDDPYGDAFAYVNDAKDRTKVRAIMKKAGFLYAFSYNRSEHALIYTLLQEF